MTINDCRFPEHGPGCDCRKLNTISMAIAQDIWDSCAKHLGPECGLDTEKVFMVTAVALAAFIEEMAESGRDEQGNAITMSDVMNVIYSCHMEAKEFLENKKP